MRGTSDLLPEQVPPFGTRKRKLRGRTQPYRKGNIARIPGPTLTAILRGVPFYLDNPADFRREIQRKRLPRGR